MNLPPWNLMKLNKKHLFFFFTILSSVRFFPRRIRRILSRRIMTAAILAFLIWIGVYAYHTPELPKEDGIASLYSNQMNHNLKKTYLKAIYNAKKSILVLNFSIRDLSIINALNEQSRRGINVRVITDAGTSKNLKNLISQSIKIDYKQGQGIMHLKLMVIDDNQVWIGSANMTGDSLNRNGNLIFAVNSPLLAQAVNEEAKSMLSFAQKPPSTVTLQLSQQKIELWFLPTAGSAALNHLQNVFYHAKSSIRIAMFAWTHKRLADTIVNAHNRGVEVEVVLDREQALNSQDSVYQKLVEAGVNVSLSNTNDLLHYKMAWIDEKILVNGSLNWTHSAFNKNDDCILIIDPLTKEQRISISNLWKVITSKVTRSYEENKKPTLTH